LHKFQTAIKQQRVNRSPSGLVLEWVFRDGASHGTISGWIKSKMAAGGQLGKLQMVTINLWNTVSDSLYACTQIILCPQALSYTDGDSKPYFTRKGQYPTYSTKRKNEKADLEK